jgi:hypothetical protein
LLSDPSDWELTWMLLKSLWCSCWCILMHIHCQTMGIATDGICRVPGIYSETRTCCIFWEKYLCTTTFLVYLWILPRFLLRWGFWLNMHSLAKRQACWKTWTKISKDRLYDLFLTHKSLGRMPASQTKYSAAMVQ